MKFLIISSLPIIAFGWTLEEYPDCNVEYVHRRNWIGNGFCNQEYNTETCGWDGGDCLEENETNPPPGWPVPGGRDAGAGDDDDEDEDEYPDCPVDYSNRRRWIGNGHCNPILNTAECGWDGGDCLESNEANPPLEPRTAGDGDEDEYPDCQVQYAHRQKWIGNGYCNDILNTPECGYDGGDCLEDNQPEPRAADGGDATVPLDGARASLITTTSSMMIAFAILGTAYGHI